MKIQSRYGRMTVAAGVASGAALVFGMATGAGAAYAAAPALPTAAVSNNVLTIRGTSANDTIRVSLAAGDPKTVVVDLGVGTDHFDTSTFTSIVADLGAGDDTFTEVPTGDVLTTPATVFGGAGNDTITGGDGNDTLFGGDGNDTILGGDGNDVIFAGAGNDTVDGSKGTDTESLGSGNDTALWVPGEASDSVDGGSGTDLLAFTGAAGNEVMALSADGSHAILTRDLGVIRMDLTGVEHVDVNALAGSDTITVNNLAGTDVREADLHLGANDGASDNVTVNGTERSDKIAVAANSVAAITVSGLTAVTHIDQADSLDHLQVNGDGGHDRVAVSKAAAAVIGVGVTFGEAAN